MNKSKILKQEIMAGAAFLLAAFVISWFLFLQKPLDEQSSVGPELQMLQETIKTKETKVSPSSTTIKSAEKLISPFERSLILERVLAAAEKANLKVKTSSTPQGIEIEAGSSSGDDKISFIENLNPEIEMIKDGQIKNPNSIPLLRISSLEITTSSIKVIISL